MFYIMAQVLKIIVAVAIALVIIYVGIFGWHLFNVKVIHDGAWRGPLTQSHIYNEKWYRTNFDDKLITDPIMAVYSVLTSVIGALLTYDIPENFDLRMDEFLADRLVAWIRECGDKYGISSPAIVHGKYHVGVNGEWKSLNMADYAMVTCIMDFERYGLKNASRRVLAVDFLYPYATLYPDVTTDYKITRKFLRHIWQHMSDEEYTIMLNPSTDALEYWAKKAVGSV